MKVLNRAVLPRLKKKVLLIVTLWYGFHAAMVQFHVISTLVQQMVKLLLKLLKSFFHVLFEIVLIFKKNDSRRNSGKARKAITKVGEMVFKTPVRSPDLNLIENLYNIVAKHLKKQAVNNNVREETLEKLSES